MAIKVLNAPRQEEEYPKQITCYECWSELEYAKDDIETRGGSYKCIVCPVCGNLVWIDEEHPFGLFPDSFYHFGTHDGAVHIEDDKVQQYVNKVIECAKDIKAGEFAYTGSGDTCVVGLKWGDGLQIIVAQNYYEDNDMVDYE